MGGKVQKYLQKYRNIQHPITAVIQARIIRMQENLNHGAGENQSIETNLELTLMLEMADKDTKPPS